MLQEVQRETTRETMTGPAEPEQRNYKITDDLSTAKLRDRIEGVGFINTHYELQFVHKFAEAILQQPQELTVGMVCAFESGQKDERIKWEKKIADAIKELEELHTDVTTSDIDWEDVGGAIENIIALLLEVK